jgi:hypothetical protein
VSVTSPAAVIFLQHLKRSVCPKPIAVHPGGAPERLASSSIAQQSSPPADETAEPKPANARLNRMRHDCGVREHLTFAAVPWRFTPNHLAPMHVEDSS